MHLMSRNWKCGILFKRTWKNLIFLCSKKWAVCWTPFNEILAVKKQANPNNTILQCNGKQSIALKKSINSIKNIINAASKFHCHMAMSKDISNSDMSSFITCSGVFVTSI